MKIRLLASLCLAGILLSGCTTDLPEITKKLTVGAADGIFAITSLSNHSSMAPNSDEMETAELDVNADGTIDIVLEIAHQYETDYDEEDNFQEFTRSSWTNVTAKSMAATTQFYSEEKKDTVNLCHWQSAEVGDYSYQTFRFTGNSDHQCEDKFTQSIDEVLTNRFVKCYMANETIDETLLLSQEHSLVCSHEYAKDIDGGGFQHGTSTRDVLLGIGSISLDHYLVFVQTTAGIKKHGYIKFKLEKMDAYKWKMILLEMGLES